MFLRSESTCRERSLVDGPQRRSHYLSDTSGAEVIDEVENIVGMWWQPAHGHHLGDPGVATPWTQTDDSASAGHELFDIGDARTR